MTLIRSCQKFRAQPAKGHALFFRYPGSWERLVDVKEQSYPTERRGRPFFRYPPLLAMPSIGGRSLQPRAAAATCRKAAGRIGQAHRKYSAQAAST